MYVCAIGRFDLSLPVLVVGSRDRDKCSGKGRIRDFRFSRYGQDIIVLVRFESRNRDTVGFDVDERARIVECAYRIERIESVTYSGLTREHFDGCRAVYSTWSDQH